MKQKRGLILASGIVFIVSAVIYALMILFIACSIESTIMPIIELDIDEMVLIGELTEANANEILDIAKLLIVAIMVMLAIIAIVNVVMGVLLIRHSKSEDKAVLEKKGLIITSLVVSFFTSGLLVVILLIIALNTRVDESVGENVYTTNSTSSVSVGDMEQRQVNEKYEAKIRRLQALRDKGAISKEEYAILLKQIFED